MTDKHLSTGFVTTDSSFSSTRSKWERSPSMDSSFPDPPQISMKSPPTIPVTVSQPVSIPSGAPISVSSFSPVVSIPRETITVSNNSLVITITGDLPPPNPNIKYIDARTAMLDNADDTEEVSSLDLVSLLASGIKMLYIQGPRGLKGKDGKNGLSIKGEDGSKGEPGDQGPRGRPGENGKDAESKGNTKSVRIISSPQGKKTLFQDDEMVLITCGDSVTLHLPENKMEASDPEDVDHYIETKVITICAHIGTHHVKPRDNAKINEYLTSFTFGSAATSKQLASKVQFIPIPGGNWVAV